jgi:hypothetical protein
MSGGRVLCQVCHRHIPIRHDGRLRAHLAAYGQRGKCVGSGMFSARVEMEAQDAERRADRHPSPASSPWDDLSPAARFNARGEWAKADALYFEYEDMAAAGGASPAALAAAYEAFKRAVDGAEELAPWYLAEPDADAG